MADNTSFTPIQFGWNESWRLEKNLSGHGDGYVQFIDDTEVISYELPIGYCNEAQIVASLGFIAVLMQKVERKEFVAGLKAEQRLVTGEYNSRVNAIMEPDRFMSRQDARASKGRYDVNFYSYQGRFCLGHTLGDEKFQISLEPLAHQKKFSEGAPYPLLEVPPSMILDLGKIISKQMPDVSEQYYGPAQYISGLVGTLWNSENEPVSR